jgi:hypothetical protein
MPPRRADRCFGRRLAFYFRVKRERQGDPKEATMKRSINYLTAAAAVLIATAGIASAQDTMTAEVPFAFHVGSHVMEPGTIRVRSMNGNTGNSVLVVNNAGAKRTYLVVPQSVGDAPSKWKASRQPKLAFDCTSGTCILARAWDGAGYAYEFHHPATKSGETVLTEIVMTPDRGN